MTARRCLTVEELLVWAIHVKRADFAVEHGTVTSLDLARRRRSAGAAVLAAGRLGARIASGVATLALDEDAARVYDSCRATLKPRDLAVVILHARAATRPSYGEGLKRFDWQPLWQWDDATKDWLAIERVSNLGNQQHRWCQVQIFDQIDEITQDRTEWLNWWGSLLRVGQHLQDYQTLEKFNVGEVGPVQKPWIKTK